MFEQLRTRKVLNLFFCWNIKSGVSSVTTYFMSLFVPFIFMMYRFLTWAGSDCSVSHCSNHEILWFCDFVIFTSLNKCLILDRGWSGYIFVVIYYIVNYIQSNTILFNSQTLNIKQHDWFPFGTLIVINYTTSSTLMMNISIMDIYCGSG